MMLHFWPTCSTPPRTTTEGSKRPSWCMTLAAGLKSASRSLETVHASGWRLVTGGEGTLSRLAGVLLLGTPLELKQFHKMCYLRQAEVCASTTLHSACRRGLILSMCITLFVATADLPYLLSLSPYDCLEANTCFAPSLPRNPSFLTHMIVQKQKPVLSHQCHNMRWSIFGPLAAQEPGYTFHYQEHTILHSIFVHLLYRIRSRLCAFISLYFRPLDDTAAKAFTRAMKSIITFCSLYGTGAKATHTHTKIAISLTKHEFSHSQNPLSDQ